MKRSCDAGDWEEVRLPVSTMLYSQAGNGMLPVNTHPTTMDQEKAMTINTAWPVGDDSADDDEQDFHLSAASVRRSSLAMEEDQKTCRVVQSKLDKSLRLLKAESEKNRSELLGAAASRGLDGVLFPGGALTLLAPRLAVVDDDKQDGYSLLDAGMEELLRLEIVKEGPKVYVYELPERFRNGGKDPTCFTADCVFGGPPMMVQGVEIWSSNQFHMPRMVYYRFLTSSRRTRDINEAEVFLVPAYSSTPSPETKCADNDDLFQTLFQLNPALQDPAWATEKASRHLFVDARGWETCNYMSRGRRERRAFR
ncbi:Ank3 [Symbiodinium sp. KB8]|nr:Ank3 [Symbiodinium sp. KB8]